MSTLLTLFGICCTIVGVVLIFICISGSIYVDTVMQQISLRMNFLIGAVYLVGGTMMMGLAGVINALDKLAPKPETPRIADKDDKSNPAPQ